MKVVKAGLFIDEHATQENSVNYRILKGLQLDSRVSTCCVLLLRRWAKIPTDRVSLGIGYFHFRLQIN